SRGYPVLRNGWIHSLLLLARRKRSEAWKQCPTVFWVRSSQRDNTEYLLASCSKWDQRRPHVYDPSKHKPQSNSDLGELFGRSRFRLWRGCKISSAMYQLVLLVNR